MKFNTGLVMQMQMSRRPRRKHGRCQSCVSSTRPQVAAAAGELLAVERCDEEAMWSNEAVAQREDPDIGRVVEQLSRA